ncbi:MAG: hypothetical protein M1814_003782 [Vezdaea aestivalis]|nr:MAG: hypothetical protein M1814_003782 [Vezdaea aestivalis]
MHFRPISVSLSGALVALDFASKTLCHNLVVCTNSKPDLASLLPRLEEGYDSGKDQCDGYNRAYPTDSAPFADIIGDQGYPWQFIWPTQDGIAMRNHRACNWLQENPIYDANKTWTVVKPGATIMLKIATNNHAHEYAERQSGHYKIYLAGSSMTQIKTADQLTNDRIVFNAPANKYAHIIGKPNFAGYGGDPGYAWLPFKLVDPTGAYLPPGTYNFVWTYWWATGGKPSIDYMIPSYSSCFDIEIREDAKDPGFLTSQLAADPNLHVKLIGNSSSPGSKDLTSPWPPYPAGYLTSNYDGVDPSTPVGKRTFQPYWNKRIDADPMPAPKHGEIAAIKSWTENQLEKELPLNPLTTFFPDQTEGFIPNMTAGETTGGIAAVDLPALSVKGSVQGTNGNGTGTGMGSVTGTGTTISGDTYAQSVQPSAAEAMSVGGSASNYTGGATAGVSGGSSINSSTRYMVPPTGVIATGAASETETPDSEEEREPSPSPCKKKTRTRHRTKHSRASPTSTSGAYRPRGVQH